MRGVVALLVLVAAQGAPSHAVAAIATQQGIRQEGTSGAPQVLLRTDRKTTQRQVQLVGLGISAYPTVDITCDGKKRTFTLTRSEFIKNRTTAIYAVPEDHAGRMLKAVECRLLTPGLDVALSRQQLRVWASPAQGTAHQPEAQDQKRGLKADPSAPNTPSPSSVTPAISPASGARLGVDPESSWTCPASQPIKANFTPSSGERCIHHMPGGAFYNKTKPERCYATEAEARQDGCRRSRR